MFVYIVWIGVAAIAVAEPHSTTVMPELDPPYCAVRYRRLCQGKGRHVACQFPSPGPGESCVNYTMIKFTKELRHFVTHYINRRRQRLATGSEKVRGGQHLPRPEVMMQVEWDRELAILAQRLADQCSFVHDDCRATVRFPYAGQTVGEVKWRHTSESDTQNVARAIRRVLDAWWGERRRVTVRQLTQPFRLTNKGNVWGHFSQLAVWTLRAVGCGAVRHGDRYPKILLVCDFSHTNMLGQRTIVPGPLANCPIHTARKQRSPYPTLCAPVRFQDEDGKNSKLNHNDPMDNDIHYDDEINIEDEDLDSIFATNASTTTESLEYTARSVQHRPHTHKRMRVNWGEDRHQENPHEQESDGNDISQYRNEHEKSKSHDRKLKLENVRNEAESESEREHSQHIKKTRGTTKRRETTIHDDDLFQDGDLDGMSVDNEEDTGSYQIKRIRDRVKSIEKSNVPDHEKASEKYYSVKPLRHHEKSHEKEIPQDSDHESISEKTTSKTQAYKIKRIRDREKDRDSGRQEMTERERTTERDRLEEIKRPQYEDFPEISVEREKPVERERPTTEKVPETERPAAGMDPPDKRLLESSREVIPIRPADRQKPVHRQRPLERPKPHEIKRPLERERVPNRDLALERERQPDRPPETGINREMMYDREKVLEKPLSKPTSLERQVTAANIVKEVQGYANRYSLTTTERERTRYMVKIGDIQKKHRNFLDIKHARKGGNRQREFHRLQENPIDKYTVEQVQEIYVDDVRGTPLEIPRSTYANKIRLNQFNEYGTSPRYLLDNFKAASSTAEPKRTQFYEPVGVRHRWRPTKDRPERPGARALITNAFLYTTTRVPAARKNSVTFASIMMDKEDVEQLFKDTGFNVGWKQYKKILS